jgi:hypothetical protein
MSVARLVSRTWQKDGTGVNMIRQHPLLLDPQSQRIELKVPDTGQRYIIRMPPHFRYCLGPSALGNAKQHKGYKQKNRKVRFMHHEVLEIA